VLQKNFPLLMAEAMIKRHCRKPHCHGLVEEGVCSRCGKVKTHGWRDDRGTRQQRGYGKDWRKTRAAFIAAKTLEAAMDGLSAYPICVLCNRPVTDEKEIHVDHIQEFHGLDDPLRLDWDNLRITHMRCHMSRTARESNKR
jgi:5-methylcytosine-specific restriction endonuclease McrA